MKKNNSIKKQKKGWQVLLILLCGLFGHTAMGQKTFTWTGATSSDWATATNWSVTGSASTSTYPGESLVTATDLVVINKNDTPNAPVIFVSPPNAVTRVTINNANGTTTSGSTLTINSGVTLSVRSAAVSNVILNGGNIVNNGILDVLTTSAGSTGTPNNFWPTGITCGAPTRTPTSATVFGYSGSGELKIDISAATIANSAAIAILPSTNVVHLATYQFLFNGITTFKLGTVANSFAIRAGSIPATAGASSIAIPVIIGGTGFTLGSLSTPIVNGGLFQVGATASNVTVNAETKLTMHSGSTNVTNGIAIGNTNTSTAAFINKGTIDILGSSARSGIQFTTFTTGAAVPIVFTNEGTINVNLNCGIVGGAPLSNGNGGSTGTTSLAVDLNNKGTLNLINTSVAVGTGAAIFGIGLAQAPPVAITNNGTLNLLGSSYSYGNKFSIINNSILNTNSELRGFTAITNNGGGFINFAKTASTATTKQVTFNVPLGSTVSLGTTYTDVALNTYSVVSQTFGVASTTLVTNVLSSAITTPASNTLTKTGTGTGDTTLGYSIFSASLANGALSSTTTNSGTINTDTASNLNVISGVSTISTSIIAPGGSAGKGITTFSAATQTIIGKLNLQVSGNTSAGVDYDQITNLTTDGGFDITNATLDVTGISGTASPVDIIVSNGVGTITGTLASVIGLTAGWSVDYSTTGKLQLVYSAPTPTANLWTGLNNTSWTDAGNWSAGVPDQNSDVTIVTTANQPIITSNVNVNSLTITSGDLTVNSGFNLTVTGALANNGGTMALASNANLIQGGTTNSNTGNITVNRNSNALSRLDYTIWSSPVTGALTLVGFSPLTSQSTSQFYNYSESANRYTVITNPTAATFAAGSGYLIRMPNDALAAPATQTFAGVFSGVPNNGTITNAMTYGGPTLGYNMIGNPYPSTIDAQAFIAANTANIESSLYFWRKKNGATGSAYAVYNPLGSTTATPSSPLPNGTIQVGQGFFVKAKSASNISFTNAMRVANNGNQIFKTKQVQKDRLWLNLINASGAFSQALIGYTADATSGVDMYDAKYFNDSAIALTSSINSGEYSIQGRPAFDATDAVALNFKTDVAGSYTIALDQFDGVFATGQDVYLVDTKTGAETNLKNNAYAFNAAAGIDNSRFTLKYQKTLKVDAQAFDENSVSVYKNSGILYVNSGSVAISTISVFDVQGRLLSEQRNVKATTATINDLRALNQVLIVKIVGEDNSAVTKKVLN